MKERTFTQIRHKKLFPNQKRVAAYARVSTGKDAMLHSLSAQISYYSNLIQAKPEWEYCGVYADEAYSGTKATRPEFQRMLDDAKAGKLDLIITKSISRFARNTVTLLETVRTLKALNVDVYFEEQNIYTLSAEGELILSFLASYAQEESRSASENLKWRIRNLFKEGIPWNTVVYGYELQDRVFQVVPAEAQVVKEIYDLYLSGLGTTAIARILNERELRTKRGKAWRHNAVAYIIRNYLYTGNLLLQTTYKDNHINKRKMINKGELAKYHIEANHEAIIDAKLFDKVQAEIKRRQRARKPRVHKEPSILSGLLTCEHCGQKYQRRVTKGKPYWMCSTYNRSGKAACPSKQIPEAQLLALIDPTENIAKTVATLSSIIICQMQQVILNFKAGESVTKTWTYPSRAKSWTTEMKAQARIAALKGRKN